MEREIREIDTKYGKIRVKIARLNGKITNIAPEYEDCARAARKCRIPLREVYNAAYKSIKHSQS